MGEGGGSPSGLNSDTSLVEDGIVPSVTDGGSEPTVPLVADTFTILRSESTVHHEGELTNGGLEVSLAVECGVLEILVGVNIRVITEVDNNLDIASSEGNIDSGNSIITSSDSNKGGRVKRAVISNASESSSDLEGTIGKAGNITNLGDSREIDIPISELDEGTTEISGLHRDAEHISHENAVVTHGIGGSGMDAADTLSVTHEVTGEADIELDGTVGRGEELETVTLEATDATEELKSKLVESSCSATFLNEIPVLECTSGVTREEAELRYTLVLALSSLSTAAADVHVGVTTNLVSDALSLVATVVAPEFGCDLLDTFGCGLLALRILSL